MPTLAVCSGANCAYELGFQLLFDDLAHVGCGLGFDHVRLEAASSADQHEQLVDLGCDRRRFVHPEPVQREKFGQVQVEIAPDHPLHDPGGSGRLTVETALQSLRIGKPDANVAAQLLRRGQ